MKFANSNVYFSGKENMLYQPEYNDVNKLRQLVSAFENSQSWKSLEPIAIEEGVSVRIGSESPIEDLSDVSVISASFKTGNESKGSISVIGPTRMPYEKVVSLVEYISKSLETVLLSNDEDDNRGESMAKEKKEKKVDEEVKQEETEVVEETATDSLEDKVAKLEEEVNTWKTDYYKVFADMENSKRRLEKEHQNSMKFMMQDFIEELLPVVDNFERSLNVQEPSEEIQTFLKGYQMIFDQLMAILEKNGVEAIEAQGKEFDPNFHQAVMTTNDENFDSNIVVEELQKGYKLKDRVIRASLVKVNE